MNYMKNDIYSQALLLQSFFESELEKKCEIKI